MQRSSMKVVGRSKKREAGIASARGFLEFVVRLRGDKPFIPKGVHRFSSHEESNAWSLKMMARRGPPDRQR